MIESAETGLFFKPLLTDKKPKGENSWNG